MTLFTVMTMPHSQRRKHVMQPARDFTEPLPQVTQRSVHALHIVVSRRVFARAIDAQCHNLRLEIWLAGWRIAIYEAQPRISTPAGIDKSLLLHGQR